MTSIVTDTNLEELLKDDIPCESPEGMCDSNHTQPATWIGSHPYSGGTCVQLQCDACITEFLKNKMLLEQMARVLRMLGGSADLRATCHKCMEKVEIPDIIIRKI